MKAFVAEVDHGGLRRLVPEDIIAPDELGRLARGRAPRPSTVVWALLDDQDAEAGGLVEACGEVLSEGSQGRENPVMHRGASCTVVSLSSTNVTDGPSMLKSRRGQTLAFA